MLCAGGWWRHDFKVAVYEINSGCIWSAAVRVGLPADGQAGLIGLWSFGHGDLIVTRLLGAQIVLNK